MEVQLEITITPDVKLPEFSLYAHSRRKNMALGPIWSSTEWKAERYPALRNMFC